MKKVFIDSDIFVRDLRYPRDARTKINQRFLQKVRSRGVAGATSIFNLLEICGILSFNLTGEELLGIYSGLARLYNVQILYPALPAGELDYDLATIFCQIQKRQSLGDAEVSFVVNRFADQITAFVSWNAVHFAGRLLVPSKTPGEFLKTA